MTTSDDRPDESAPPDPGPEESPFSAPQMEEIEKSLNPWNREDRDGE
jgi:hypothetical protein